MNGYIYFIFNKVTQEYYVGQTTNYSRRKGEHLLRLRENKHPNKKLQNSFNKYSENNFIFSYKRYTNITKDQLNELEKKAISEKESYKKGFNLTLGGIGGNTRFNLKLSFEEFCFAYFGNKKYKGMTGRTASFLNCDSSTISSIVRDKSYDIYRQQAIILPEEKKEEYLQSFVQQLNIEEEKPRTMPEKLDNNTIVRIMCVVSCFGRGIEACILRKFNRKKGFIYHLMTTPNSYFEAKQEYKQLSNIEIQNIGEEYFKKWELDLYSKVKIKKDFRNLVTRYTDCGV